MGPVLEKDGGACLAGRYRVIERLGSGGMATVYLAEDSVLGRRVAVKRMRGADTDDARRFHREARLGATLTHPNIVTVFDAVSDEDGVLIVMEYVEGETLAAAIRRGPLDPDRALTVLQAVAGALDHAHESGIVHRDVKPGNILLGADGVIKLADLGIARATEATRITSTLDIVGTLSYVAPERLDGSMAGDVATDVYGLAAVAYEMLSGERFHRGSTPAEVMRQVAAAPPPDLRETWPEAPEPLAEAIQQGLDRDPARRPASAGELVRRLEPALVAAEQQRRPSATTRRPRPTERTAPLDLPPDHPPRLRIERFLPWRRRPQAALPGMAALTVAALVALAAGVFGGGDDRSRVEAEKPSKGSENREQAAAGGQSGGGSPDPAQGAELNEQGYSLIQQGRYEQAVPVLERSVASFPEGTDDLNYAYALYNLGHALRKAGRPEKATPILERRLQIPNQRETVKRELELARSESGGSEDAAQ